MTDRTASAANPRTVRRAVAQSQAVRAAVSRRRRRRIVLAACLAALAGAPVAWFMAEPATAVAMVAANKAQDLAEILAGRSPGQRTTAELTKHARAAAKVRKAAGAATPAEKDAPQAEAPSAAALVDLLAPPVAPVAVVADGLPPSLVPPSSLNAIVTSPPGGPSPIPGEQDKPAHLPTSEPREQLTPTSAVPEPGSWAAMLTGFGLMAWRIRRRKRQAQLKRCPA